VTFRLGLSSKSKLVAVHPALVAVVNRAIEITEVDFGVTEGVRSVARQRELFAQGKSKTLNSRHITGHAVDLVAMVLGNVTWEWDYYRQIASAMKEAAKELNVDMEWGGDWTDFKDGPHFQLTWASYPARRDATAGVMA
jgi:peptidoglycan L-alanyl-D-glutamate endopeptidase CwlK